MKYYTYRPSTQTSNDVLWLYSHVLPVIKEIIEELEIPQPNVSNSTGDCFQLKKLFAYGLTS